MFKSARHGVSRNFDSDFDTDSLVPFLYKFNPWHKKVLFFEHIIRFSCVVKLCLENNKFPYDFDGGIFPV